MDRGARGFHATCSGRVHCRQLHPGQRELHSGRKLLDDQRQHRAHADRQRDARHRAGRGTQRLSSHLPDSLRSFKVQRHLPDAKLRIARDYIRSPTLYGHRPLPRREMAMRISRCRIQPTLSPRRFRQMARGTWSQSMSRPGNFSPNSLAIGVQLGINTFDTVNQVSSTGSVVVNFSYGFLVRRPSDALITMADVNGPLATTTAAVSANLTKPCPPGVAFRDFRETLPATGLRPFPNNPIILQSQTELYQSGGLSNPYVTSVPLYYNGFYWGFANSTPTIDHSAWTSFSLYKSHDGITWTEVTTNAPYLQAFGSIFANPTVAAAGTGYGATVSGTLTWTGSNCSTNPVANVTTNGGGGIATATYVSGICTHALWPTTQTTWSPGGGLSAGTGAELTYVSVRGTGTNSSFYQLNPSFLPYGCTISSVHHQFCVEFGTSNPAQSLLQTYLAWSDTVDGVYTPVGCTGPGTCASPTPVIAGACTTTTCPTVTPTGTIANQNLPSIINVGGPTGTNYTYTSAGVVGNTQMQIWATAAIPTGAAFTWAQTAVPAPITGTWDATASATYANPMVLRNSCGFYELYWTAVSLTPGFGGSPNKEQVVGYAVSNSPLGPWWKYSAPIIPVNSPLFNGIIFIGDTSPIVINGRYIWLGNFDNGTNLSEAMGAAMQDACSY